MSENATPTPPASVFAARLAPDGPVFDAPADQSILLSAEAALVALPNACRNGTCRTCLCRLHSGQISYRIEWPGLLAEEKAEGYILACVAHPLSDVVFSIASP